MRCEPSRGPCTGPRGGHSEHLLLRRVRLQGGEAGQPPAGGRVRVRGLCAGDRLCGASGGRLLLLPHPADQRQEADLAQTAPASGKQRES